MKDAVIIFIVGLFTIAITISVINLNKKKEKEEDVKVVCPHGGVPDWNCIPKLRK